MTGIVMGSGGGGGSLPKLSKPAGPGHILAGREAIDSRGNRISGSILSKETQSYIPGDSVQSIAAGQYLIGEQIIAAVPTETRQIPPGESRQIISPSPGSYFSQVQVLAVKVFCEERYLFGRELELSLPFTGLSCLLLLPLELDYDAQYSIIGSAVYRRDGSCNVNLLMDTEEDYYTLETDALEWTLSGKDLSVRAKSSGSRFGGSYLLFAYGEY
ncbi:MAG: hypothetical protein Q4B50_02950 [Bacillota bacterium]|nr:hypothetical protein [Bacillota bacterium]